MVVVLTIKAYAHVLIRSCYRVIGSSSSTGLPATPASRSMITMRQRGWLAIIGPLPHANRTVLYTTRTCTLASARKTAFPFNDHTIKSSQNVSSSMEALFATSTAHSFGLELGHSATSDYEALCQLVSRAWIRADWPGWQTGPAITLARLRLPVFCQAAAICTTHHVSATVVHEARSDLATGFLATQVATPASYQLGLAKFTGNSQSDRALPGPCRSREFPPAFQFMRSTG